jgi:hypothetical protein
MVKANGRSGSDPKRSTLPVSKHFGLRFVRLLCNILNAKLQSSIIWIADAKAEGAIDLKYRSGMRLHADLERQRKTAQS